MTRCSAFLLVVAVSAFSACGSDAGLVARAGDQTWTVDEAAALLAADADLPPELAVVRAMANLWIDYTLLATAVAADTTLVRLDVSDLVQDLVNEQLILALRDSVIVAEPISNDELLERYREEAPGSQVQARQILLTWSIDATEAQKDSVRSAIEELRRRIVDAGEDFAAVAEAHSQDPASAGQRGSMGLVVAGQLVAPLGDAVFALLPGEVSQPLESPYGLHLIEVEERLTPTVESFRLDVLTRRAAQAESTYVARLADVSMLEVVEDVHERVREMALNPRMILGGREVNRALVRYDGGQVTEREVLRYMQAQPPEARNQVSQSRDETVPDAILRGIAHQELLAAEARGRGWSVPQEIRDGLAQTIRRSLADAARQLTLMPIVPVLGQTSDQAVEEAVTNLLTNILSGEQTEVTPLGTMSYVLRAQYRSRVVETGLDEVVARVGGNR